MYTSTPFSTLKRSMADLLIFLLLMSITKSTLTQSALIIYYLSPTSLTLEIYSLSY